jgi:hypothetical protein
MPMIHALFRIAKYCVEATPCFDQLGMSGNYQSFLQLAVRPERAEWSTPQSRSPSPSKNSQLSISQTGTKSAPLKPFDALFF